MQEYGIVYLLPGPVADYQRELRLKIEKAFELTGNIRRNAPPHITLKYRFQTEDIGPVERLLSEFTATQSKTQWSIQGFNTFEHLEHFVIYMDVVPTPEAKQAHSRLTQQLETIDWMQWKPFDGANLTFHATLAHKGLTPANFKQVMRFVEQQKRPNFDLFFDNVTLLEINSNVHTVYRRFQIR